MSETTEPGAPATEEQAAPPLPEEPLTLQYGAPLVVKQTVKPVTP